MKLSMTAPEVARHGRGRRASGGSRWEVNRWALIALPGVALLAVFFVYPAVQILSAA